MKNILMKHSLQVFSFLLLLITVEVHAQPYKVLNAWGYIEDSEYLKAAEEIDLAIEDEQTKGIAKTWYYRGIIYENIYTQYRYSLSDTIDFDLYENRKYKKFREYGEYRNTAVVKAAESFKIARKLDLSRIDEKDLNNRYLRTSTLLFLNGVDLFNEGDYNQALKNFEFNEQIKLEYQIIDSLSIYNQALCFEQLGEIDKAIDSYKRTIEIEFDEINSYITIINLLEQEGDIEEALKFAAKARDKYPNDIDLIKSEIDLFLGLGDFNEALKSLNKAIESEPENSALYFARGSVYDSKNEPEKAKTDFIKALELNPDDVNAAYNLGAIYYNEGAEAVNSANKLTDDDEYTKAREIALGYFRKAIPYLEKVHMLIPDDSNTMQYLLVLYNQLNDTEKYEEMKRKVEQ